MKVEISSSYISFYDEKTFPDCDQVSFFASTNISLPDAAAIAKALLSDDYEELDAEEIENTTSWLLTVRVKYYVEGKEKSVVAKVQQTSAADYNSFLVFEVV